MSAEIIMPKMGDAMTEGKVIRWYKKPGDAVKKGEPVAEIETDKVNLDLEAEGNGTLGEYAAKEGDVVAVGGLLAKILGEGEKDTPQKPAAQAEDKQEKRRATDKKDSVKHTTGEYAEAVEMKGPRVDRSAAPSTSPSEAPQPASSGRKRSSPLARKIARELGVSLDAVQGSGPQGRVVADDVKKARTTAAQAPSAAKAPSAPIQLPPMASLETKTIPHSAMRRTIAKRLSESIGPIPHFFLTADYDVTSLTELRTQLIDISGAKISLNDFIVRAVALTLRHHPQVNASWGEEAITQHGEVHVGIAVATPDGLITPVVRDADRKSVVDIAAEVRVLADKAKGRKLMPNEYQGSTFTISNLGAWGIEEFTAIINPPNSAILAIGAASAQPVVIDKQIVIRERMKVTMSCDHRVIDGAVGADFLKTLRQYVEQPLRLLV